MAAKLVFLVGMLGVGGYVGHTMMNHDPSVIAMSRDQIEAKLVGARTAIPRRDGPGEIRIWGAGPTSDGVALEMRYDDTAPLLKCKAIISAIAADTNRVTADCSDGSTSTSATARTQAALRAPMFEEHIRSTLAGEAFDRRKVDAKEMGAVLGNMNGMNREAMKMADEEQRKNAEGR